MIRSRPPARNSPAMNATIKPVPPDDGAKIRVSNPVPRPKSRIPRNVSPSSRAGDCLVNSLFSLEDRRLNKSCGEHSDHLR